MAAPASTSWGSAVGGYGRIGLYVTTSSTETATTLTVEVWFWSKYSVSDSANNLYFDNKATNAEPSITAMTNHGSVSVSTTVASGSGWSTDNQVKIKTFTYTHNRGTNASTRYLYAKLADIDRVGGTMAASKTVTIPARTKYTITYNANGGTGAPSTQTKTYASTLTLSSTKPTRTGYTFKGWGTSASATTVAYAAGATYTSNASITLYAIWTPNVYTITYSANGGSGAPAAQKKTHGVALTLSSTKPTRAKYTFKGWGTSASATTVAYAPGASYTKNTGASLYAIWELAYFDPIIHSLKATRCDSNGNEADDGKCGLVSFSWETGYDVSAITIAWTSSAESGSTPVTTSGKNGYVNIIIGNNALSADASYSITITVSDSEGTSTATTTLPGALFPIDALAGGKGVSFGKPAELEGVADFGFDAKFNKPVYGKALGMDRLPAIPANSDLNNYMEPGCYAVHSNAIAATCANIPVDRAGRLEVWSATGEGVRLEQWSYLRQRYIPYNSVNAVWEREVTRSADNVWRYYDWWKSSLTPAASEKVYSKAAITIALNANTTLGALNTYTKIPLDKLSISTSDRLTMQSNSIRIGANISHVKVSGQFLVKCGSITGNRHARLQKESDGTTTSLAWVVLTGTASSNTVFHFTPFIVPVKEGDLLKVVYYTGDVDDMNVSGSAANGWQTYLTAEEL